MKRVLLTILLSALSFPVFAQNLLRDDMTPDGIGGIVDWNLPNPKSSVQRLDELGPNNMPILRFSSKSGSSCSHVVCSN